MSSRWARPRYRRYAAFGVGIQFARLTPRVWIVLVAVVALLVWVAAHALLTASRHSAASTTTVSLDGISQVPTRVHRSDYDRTQFGPAWSDASAALGSNNGCDTRDDILDRDLTDKTFTHTTACPRAVASGELRSPYSGEFVEYRRGARSGKAVQIDHIVPLAYAWDMGAWAWNSSTRMQLANDPANLVAVDGPANQDKGDKPPAVWMPRNKGFTCQYAAQFTMVLRAYGLSVEMASVRALINAARRC